MQEGVGKYCIFDGPDTIEIGDDVFIGNYVHIRPDVTIGNWSHIRDHCFIAEGVEIGHNTRVYQFCNIGAWTKIGSDCFIGVGTVFANDKQICWPDATEFVPRPPVVEDKVKIGMNATILPGVILAEGCVIGAGSVVTKSTEPNAVYVGNPATKIKLRF
jgi:acetyltransferase-like isoleucine patch superfamily enzyme